ncbi:MAG: redoxin domain-containing protein [Elusimicrobia bacterium]|nr:redoxin domain-containing protein [Elusimicrobiota bacterium]
MKKIGFFFLILSFFAAGSIFALSVGDKIPDFGLPSSDGNYYILSSVRGDVNSPNVLVFSFFDSNCFPCRKELPYVQKVYRENKGKKVLFFMVAVGEEKAVVKKCIKKWGIKIPVLFDVSMNFGRACGVVAGSVKNIPKIFVISKDGSVKKILKGFHRDIGDKLSAAINSALGEKYVASAEVDVIYTNSANGVIESCDCPANPYGGLVRRLTFFSKVANPDIKISAGDFFSPNGEPLKNSYVAKIMEKLDYDAICLGDQEFKTGARFLTDILKNVKLPIVNANMQICDGESCYLVGVPYVIKNVRGIKVGITAVLSPNCFIFYPQDIKKMLKFKNPVAELKNVVGELRKKSDLIFVIAHSPEREIGEIRKNVSGIDVIFAGHTQNKLFRKGGTVVVQAGASGRYVGELKIEITKDGKKKFSNRFYALVGEIEKDKWGLSQSEEYLIKYRKALEDSIEGK